MAPIEEAVFRQHRKSFSRTKKQILKIDMTPMVDLGFLLITFFVFTTTVSMPTATELYMPDDKNVTNPSRLPQSLALTFLLGGNDRVFYYNGDFDEAEKANQVFETNYSVYNGIGNVIREKKKSLDLSGRFPEGSKGLMLIIKPGNDASYKNTVDALDEATINEVKKYAIVEPTEAEETYLSKMSVQGKSSMT